MLWNRQIVIDKYLSILGGYLDSTTSKEEVRGAARQPERHRPAEAPVQGPGRTRPVAAPTRSGPRPQWQSQALEALITCATGDPNADPPIQPEGWAIKEILDRIDGKAAQSVEYENVNETRVLDAAEQAGRIKELFMAAAKSKTKQRKAIDLTFEDLDV